MEKVSEMFGCLVFNEQVMRERLPEATYQALKRTMQIGKKLDPKVANIVASAMKDWAIEKGATHFTHWFQPMNDITAEKHDSFIFPVGDGSVIMEFSGKELIRGEPDASSFPSGGLRATFEARGYTAWDPTSYAFIKDGTLCIPTAFCSYGGEALDKKTPLLRSMETLNREALRILRLFGKHEVQAVYPTVGAEQEYFLLDKALYDRRKDLIYTGRTLFGAKPPKGQELEDHYFGNIQPRVVAYMKDLDQELWKLGVYAKTKHNETAPSQHELACLYCSANLATDHNQLTMETMKKVAARHGLVCVLHEKPFSYVNGSGKHNNWSLSTDTGVNLFEPGDTPYENAQFLLFLCAVIKAVDEHQDLLRISVASAGNDLRLGAQEAPPAVLSIFLGTELTDILNAIETGNSYDNREAVQMKVGVHILPRFPKDNTDRNRTSPFAFTGNKFEFRMLGASTSVANPNIILNTIMAESLSQFADILESADHFEEALHTLIQQVIHDHKPIIFNGNGYDEAWVKDATENRGLLDLRTTPDCLPYLISEKNIQLFGKHHVFTESELHSRYEIYTERYYKILKIEATTMLGMAQAEIFPAACSYARALSETVIAKRQVSSALSCRAEQEQLATISSLTEALADGIDTLKQRLEQAEECETVTERALYYKNCIVPAMQELRKAADELEMDTDKRLWPFPTYGDMLFSV